MRAADDRPLSRFQCPIPGTDQFLQPDGSAGPERTAAWIGLKASATESESVRIRRAAWALAGGSKAWFGLDQDWRDLTEELDAEIIAARQVDGVDAEMDARELELLRLTWNSHTAEAWRQTRRMLDRVEFLAAWSVLCVEAPDGWRTLEQIDALPTDVHDVLRYGYHLALQERAAGKAPSSSS